VTEADAGHAIQVHGATKRFSICLDEAKHPPRELDATDCPFGYISNMSVNGPDRYPVGFEVIRGGSCTVRDRDYEVRIVTTA